MRMTHNSQLIGCETSIERCDSESNCNLRATETIVIYFEFSCCEKCSKWNPGKKNLCHSVFYLQWGKIHYFLREYKKIRFFFIIIEVDQNDVVVWSERINVRIKINQRTNKLKIDDNFYRRYSISKPKWAY